MSPAHCARCQIPLPHGSDAALCPDCQLAGTASLPSPPAPSSPDDVTDTFSSVEAKFAALMQSAAPPPGAAETRTPLPSSSSEILACPAAEYLPPTPPGYELIRELGHGGMGNVYLAREVVPERTVAIKFLNRPGLPGAFERFRREVQALAELDHRNVVRVYTVETNWREPFFTMEYATGGTLADLVGPDRPLPDPADAARLVLGAAEGVATAHAAGILHRDLKPSNILLAGDRSQETGDGKQAVGSGPGLSPVSCPLTPKVSDFGLAKRTDHDDGLTRTGPLGTPGYMSPEAAEGRYRDIGPASDVYGLGATLYHLLTGRPPFSGGSQADVILRVLTDVPDRPRAIRPEVPRGLEAVVLRALEKDPAKRYATAEAFAADLRRALMDEKTEAPESTWPRRAWRWLVRNRGRLATATGCVLLAAGLAVVIPLAFPRPQPDPPPTPEQVAEAELARLNHLLAEGTPVTLIGETGLPAYHRFRLEPGTLGESPLGDRTCYFHTFNYSLVELFPAPPVDRYRVTLELQHHVSRFHDPAALAETDWLGFYFGWAAAPVPDGATVHAMFALTYKDFDPQRRVPPGQQQATLRRLGFAPQPGRPLLDHSEKVAGHRFMPPAQRPGPWRPLTVDVSPDEVVITWWPADLERQKPRPQTRWAGGRPGVEYETLKRRLGEKSPGAERALPAWGPRMPFGIVAYKAAAGIRNVVVTPNPKPDPK